MKPSKNKAKDVETKPAPKPKVYALPDELLQVVARAILNSVPKQFTVSEINQIVNQLSQLKEVTNEQNDAKG